MASGSEGVEEDFLLVSTDWRGLERPDGGGPEGAAAAADGGEPA